MKHWAYNHIYIPRCDIDCGSCPLYWDSKCKGDNMSKVFLGGTCNESVWRNELIPMLKIDYFNPVVDDWTPECQAEEERQKNDVCDIHLYVITPKMTGVFSIAELVESAINKAHKCVFCFLPEDDGLTFTKEQIKSLGAVGKLVEKYHAIWKYSLSDVARYINAGYEAIPEDMPQSNS